MINYNCVVPRPDENGCSIGIGGAIYEFVQRI